MTKLYDVIIAGAGPVGLFVAGELALARCSVLVLERDTFPESPWKTLPLGRRSLNTITMEAFYRRGLLDKIYPPEMPGMPNGAPKMKDGGGGGGFKRGGFLAGISLDASRLDLARHKYRLEGPCPWFSGGDMDRVEAVLAERAEAHGVEIVRGQSVGGITHHDGGSVTVETEQGQSFTGKWLVGCDGGRSMVRKAAGFDFPGTEGNFTGYAVKCEFNRPEKMGFGFNMKKNGIYAIAPESMYLIDYDNGAFDRRQEVTREHVQAVFARVSEQTDVQITKMDLASSFNGRARQVTQYRKGRVLLAGDAAHIHGPMGSQGLNLGLGDAINLGWKLAATVHMEKTGSADLALLDTYHNERAPAGAAVLDWTRAQMLMLQPDSQPLLNLIKGLLNTDDGMNYALEKSWGLSLRYEIGDHPLVGCSAPDFEMNDGSRLGPKLAEGNGLLVDFEKNAALQELAEGTEKVLYVGMAATEQLGLRALLVRPDGVVAWAVDEGAEIGTDVVRENMAKWFSW